MNLSPKIDLTACGVGCRGGRQGLSNVIYTLNVPESNPTTDEIPKSQVC